MSSKTDRMAKRVLAFIIIMVISDKIKTWAKK